MLYDKHGALLKSVIPELPEPRRGKVRDIYDLGNQLLLVATDRISAFDCVMPNGIPDKGRILTRISRFWFQHLDWMPNHLVSMDPAKFPGALPNYAEHLRDRAMLVRKTSVVPIECVARGYLVGSGWGEYKKGGSVCGIRLRPGYVQADKLDAPIYTPATKEESGHDENISFERMSELVGAELAEQLRGLTLKIYQAAADYARTKGIIIADTKFEFGRTAEGKIILIDEVLTPDSSRFWPADQYLPGSNPVSLDKQFVRDWLESVNFNKTPPAPELPADVVSKTREKYLEALRQLTGQKGL